MPKNLEKSLQKVRDTKGMEASVNALLDAQLEDAKQELSGLPPEVMAKVEASLSGLRANVGPIIDAVMENASAADTAKLDKAAKKHAKK